MGKTHLVSALGLVAAQHRFSTYYVNCHQLIEQLEKAHFELPARQTQGTGQVQDAHHRRNWLPPNGHPRLKNVFDNGIMQGKIF